MIENLVSGPILAQIFPALPKKFFWSFASAKYYALLQAIIVCNFKENYRTKLEKMAKNKKTSFGTNFGPFGSNLGPQFFFMDLLDVRHYCKLSLYAISRKANEAKLRKWPKPSFQVRFWPKFVLSSQKKIFVWHFASTRCHALLQATIICSFKEN